MTQTICVRRGENGEVQPIRIKNNSGDVDISWAVSADSTIVFKDPNDLDTEVLVITDSDFAISTPDVNWTPKDSDYTSLTKQDYVGFVHLKSGSSRETIAKFFLYVEDV